MEVVPTIGYATRVRGDPSAPRSRQNFDNAAQIRFGPDGSVIVSDTNGRFFAPAAGRNFLVGVSVYARF